MSGGLAGRAEAAGLTELAEARWPDGQVPAPIPGFVISEFSPRIAAVAETCLRSAHGHAPVGPDRGERTAVVLASVDGDTAIAAAVAEAVDTGRRVSPLLFFQSVPNAVAGHIAARWGLAGPVVCTSPCADPFDDVVELAGLLFDGGDADEALLVLSGSGDEPAVAALVRDSH
jgi:hypothetical protein